MARKAFNPHSKRFDVRLINRKQNVFSRGMMKDMEPSDLPYDAVADLFNADGYKDSIKGRKGSRLHSDLELPFDYLTISTDPIYGDPANTNFILSDVVDGIGSLKPLIVSPGTYIDPFDEEMVEKLIYGLVDVPGPDDPMPFPLVVTEYINGGEVKVEVSDAVAEALEASSGYLRECKIVGKINAYFYDSVTGFEYYLIGTTVYTLQAGGSVWNKYILISGSISDSNSQFFKVQENIVLNNLGGIFVVNDIFKGHYVWKANDVLPTYPLGDRSAYRNNSKYSDPSTYNYVYSFSRLTGNVLENRNSEATFIELETPPFFVEGELKDNTDTEPYFFPMENQEDFFTVNAPIPIEDVLEKRTEILLADANNYAFWVNLSEDELKPFLKCVFNTINYSVYFDFSGSTTLADVAKALERGLHDVSSDFRVKYNADSSDFIFYNRDGTNDFSFEALVSSDYDLITEGVLGATGDSQRMGIRLDYFRYPENRRDITHYSIYRTKDISGHLDPELSLLDPTLTNNPNIYGWIEDIPVCGGFKGNVTFVSGGGTDELDITDGTLTDASLIGTTLKVVGLTEEFNITDIKNTTTYYGTISTGADALVRNFYFGADVGGIAYKTEKEIGTSDYTFTEDDIGDTIFWFDGTTSVIEDVVSGVATTIDSNTKTSQGMLKTPTYRSHYDTVNDIVQNGFLRYWSLNTRFMQQMPSTNIAAYDSGVLMSAERDVNEINYVDTLNFRHLGYHNRANQKNNKLEDGIRCILVVNNLFCILTANKTFNINPKQGRVITTEFGEFYTHLPDPFLVNGSIGITHQFKWVYGDKGDVAIMTSEPALRLFNGVEYQRDRSLDAITDTELKLMNASMVIGYNTANGLLVWGYREK
jgi:hypothetical protein